MEVLHISQFEKYLKPRPREFHKGNAGSVLVVGGEHGFWGAPQLAGMAVLRVGAGLVRIAIREGQLLCNPMHPELMCHGVTAATDLENLFAKTDVVIIGPGLGQSSVAEKLVEAVFQTDKPLVVDADALNLLAKNPIQRENWILTPHPGEASRLLKTTVEKIQQDREASVIKISHLFGGVCVLKGAGSLIASRTAMAICKAGNPGMATAGMGDVLSGVIGGLLAQKVPLESAAKLGVLIHALAGDKAAEVGERGMVASDLMPFLRELVNWE